MTKKYFMLDLLHLEYSYTPCTAPFVMSWRREEVYRVVFRYRVAGVRSLGFLFSMEHVQLKLYTVTSLVNEYLHEYRTPFI